MKNFAISSETQGNKYEPKYDAYGEQYNIVSICEFQSIDIVYESHIFRDTGREISVIHQVRIVHIGLMEQQH